MYQPSICPENLTDLTIFALLLLESVLLEGKSTINSFAVVMVDEISLLNGWM
jgi:hypothetical protein